MNAPAHGVYCTIRHTPHPDCLQSPDNTERYSFCVHPGTTLTLSSELSWGTKIFKDEFYTCESVHSDLK